LKIVTDFYSNLVDFTHPFFGLDETYVFSDDFVGLIRFWSKPNFNANFYANSNNYKLKMDIIS